MEPTMRLSLNNVVSVSKKDRKQEVKHVAFHPNEPSLFIAVDDEVYVCDILSGAMILKFRTGLGEVVSVCSSANEPLLAVLLVHEEETIIQIWNLHQQTCKAVHNVTKNVSVKKGPVTMGVNPLQPKLYYTQNGSKVLYVLDMATGSKTQFEMKKPITTMVCHSFKPLIACTHSDGTVKIYNSNTGAVMHSFSEMSSLENPSTKEKIVPTLSLLAFHPSKDYIVAGTPQGQFACWDLSAKEPFMGIKTLPSSMSNCHSLFFHSTTSALLVFDKDGYVTPFFFFPVKDKWITDIPNTPPLQPGQVEAKNRYAHLPSYISLTSEILSVSDMIMHSKFNYACFLFKRVGKSTVEEFKLAHLLDSLRVSVYSVDTNINLSHLHIPRQLPAYFFVEPEINEKGKMVFTFPNEIFYLDGHNLMAYSPSYNDVSLAKALPVIDSEQLLFRPTKILYSANQDRFLLFVESVNSNRENNIEKYCCMITKDMETKDIVPVSTARDGVFVGDHGEFLVISENGRTAEILQYTGDIVIPKPYALPIEMTSVFATPLDGNNTVLFYDAKRNRLIASAKEPLNHQEMKYKLDSNRVLPLNKDEVPIQLIWQESLGDPEEVYGALVTNQRLIIVNSKLKVMAEHNDKSIVSCIWVGMTVLFTTATHLMYMTILGTTHPLLSLQHPQMYIIGVLCDRVVMCVHRSGQAIVASVAVGLMEPLMMGILDLSKIDYNVDRPDVEVMLRTIANCYDGKRISSYLIEELISSDESELALQLLLANPHLLAQHIDLAWKMALRTHHFNTAFAILTHPVANQIPQAKLHRKLKKLADICSLYGQFEVARRCYEAVQDGPSLLYLYLLTQSRTGVERVLSKAKKSPGYFCNGLQTVCEQHLQRMPPSLQEGCADTNLAEQATPPSSFSPASSLDNKYSPSSLEATYRHGSQSDTYGPLHSGSRNLPIPAAAAKIPANKIKDERPLLEDWPFVSEKEQKRWKVEMEAKVACEMKTMPLSRGSGNHVIGNLLITKMLQDWFARQLTSFYNSPARLQNEEFKRRSTLENLEALSEERSRLRIAPTGRAPAGPSTTESLDEKTSGRFRRTFTVGGLVGAGASSRTPAADRVPAGDNASGKRAPDGTEAVSQKSSTPTEITAPNQLFKSALWKLERGDYSGSLMDINACLQGLASRSSEDNDKKTVFVVRYKMLVQILIQMRQEKAILTSRPIRLAFLSTFLARLVLLRRHKMLCLRMAIKYNLDCKNYGTAATLIETLLKQFAIPDKAIMEEKLAKCKEQGLVDASPFPSLKLCYKTLAVIDKATCTKCKYCDAVFTEDAAPTNTYCPCCYRRTLAAASNLDT